MFPECVESVPEEEKLRVLVGVDDNSAVACEIMRLRVTQWDGPRDVGSLADAAI